MTISGLLGQGFGEQSPAFSPNFPQIFSADDLTPLQLPGCSDIQSIGSPILLAFQAQNIIDEAMRLQTKDSFVRYVYFKEDTATNGGVSPNPFKKFYTLVFEIRDQSEALYIGLYLESPINSIGSVKFLKFILNPSVDTVKKVLKIVAPADLTPKGFNCGDLKMVFNSFGNDPRSSLNGQFPGLNRNGLSPALLQALKNLAERTKSTSADTYIRDCSPSRFVKMPNYYSHPNLLPRYPKNLAASAIASNDWFIYNEISKCNVEAKRIVAKLILSCNAIAVAGVSNGFIARAQAVMITPFTNTLEESPVIGTGPFTTTFNIDLSLPAERIELYYDDTPGLGVKWWSIQVFDSKGINLGDYRCGAAPATLPPYKQRVYIVDLLGFWVQVRRIAVNSSTPSNTVSLGAFGFIKYE